MSLDAASIRAQLFDPIEVAAIFQLEPSREERKKWKCPRHGGASLSLRTGADETLQVRCFGGCDLSGDLWDLARAVYGDMPFPELVSEVARVAGIYDDGRPALPRRAPVPPPPPKYPPRSEVEAFFHVTCLRLESNPEACAYLRGRGIDPRDAQTHGLLRVLPTDAPCPSWAVCGRPWSSSGHVLVAPVFDHTGTLRSVRGWRPGAEAPKRVAPVGFSTSGLVLADLHARALLTGENPSRGRIIIAEGEPSFLAATLAFRLSEANRPAVFGIVAGSWTPALAARIPDGARVDVATDADPAGDNYATTIAGTLSHRCDVRRVRVAA